MKFTNSNFKEIALSIFSWIKNIKGDAVNLANLGNQESTLVDHKVWSNLLQQHVTNEGKVNYKGFIKDELILDDYLQSLSSNPPSKNWNKEEKLSYWINAYNAFTIKLIVDNYPLKSIKDISGKIPMINSPWDIKFFKIGNIDFDLNTIEHEILRKQFEEPRIHFAINCASISCSKLLNEAFDTDRLDEQLEEQTKSFINNPEKNIISKTETKLSLIFSWFASDFTKTTSLKSFISKYQSAIEEHNEIQYLDYNWNLNE